MKQRLAYLDNIKAISIVMVVFCHYTLLPDGTVVGNVFMTLAWGAVPCFMMVSGSLMNNKSSFSWRKYVNNIISTYLVICAWRLIYILIHILMNGFIYSYENIFKCVFFFADIEGVDLGVFWYMIAYMMIQIFYPLAWNLLNGENEKIYFYLIGISFTQGIAIPSICIVGKMLLKNEYMDSLLNMSKNILPFSTYANMLFYFLLGGILLKYRAKIKERISLAKCIEMTVGGLLILLLEKYYEIKSWGWNGYYINDGYSRITTCLIAIGFFIAVDHLSSEKENFIGKLVGQSTLGIYYMHFIILIVANVYIYNSISNLSFIMNVIKTLVVVILCVILTLGIRKVPLLKSLVL